MAPDDRWPDDPNALDRALSADAPDLPLDPVLAETVRRLRHLHRPIEPPPVAADRIWEGIMNGALANPGLHGWRSPGPNHRRPTSSLPAAALLAPARPTRLVPWGGWLAAAALVLLALAWAWIAVGNGRLPIERAPAVAPGDLIPAPTDIRVERLVDIAVEDLPAGEMDIWVERVRFRPGPARIVTSDPFPAPNVIAVDTGEIGAEFGGQEHLMRSGDQLVIPADMVNAQWNAGAAEAAMISISFNNTTFVPSEWDESQIVIDGLVQPFTVEMPGGTAQVVLERLTLPPGSAMPAEAAVIEGYGVETGTLGVTLDGDNLPYGWRPGEERTFGVGTMPRLIRPGTPMTLRNAGDGPLVMYRVTVAPEAGA